MKQRLSFILPFLLALAVPLCSSATTLHFDEFGTDPVLDVNGMHVFGITFGFTPGMGSYNGTIGTNGNTVLVSDPLLVGFTSETLSLAFDSPVDVLQFDVVLLSMVPIPQAYTVNLSNGDVLSGGTAPQPSGFYSEGHFSYSGQPFDSATISFYNGLDSTENTVFAFGLDNLTVEAPEPGATVLVGLGIIGLAVCGRRLLC